uniref:26S proteasome subunit RPN7 n=1 Tax=Solanum tuberosum TaxID=4113 RepID=M1C8P8_SOLTU
MDSEEGTQQPQLVLAHKLFLLTHPDVNDLDKVRLREEVLEAVVSNDMAPLFETLVSKGVFSLNLEVLDPMRVKNADELKKLDENCLDSPNMLLHPCRILQKCTVFEGSDTPYDIFEEFEVPSNIGTQRQGVRIQKPDLSSPKS